MKSTLLSFIVGTSVMLVASTPALAHHSRLNFEMEKNITLRGIVKSYWWGNPHSHIVMTVADKSADPATVGTWEIEASSVSIMTSRGWTPRTYKPGDPIAVVVHPDKSGSHSVLLFYVVKPDGTRLFRAEHRYPLEQE